MGSVPPIEYLSTTRTACAPADLPYLMAMRIVTMLETNRFDLTTEKLTQGELDPLLVASFGREAVSREHRLSPRDVPDFLILGKIVLEMKGPRHRQPEVLRQVERYASHPQVEVIIVATARAMHLPRQINGKLCGVVNLGRAWL